MLPAKVHRKGPSLYYVHQNKWTRLCRADDPEHVLYAALARVTSQGDDMAFVLTDYKTNALPKLALATQAEYERIINTRLIPVFGEMQPSDITSGLVAQYLKRREDAGAGVIANREVAVLSSAFNHAMRLGLADLNPCYGVRRNRERPKTRYVTNDELRAALRKAPTGLRHLLWGAYLTGLRQKDLISMTWDQVTEDGLEIQQSKDGKHLLIELTDSLRRLLWRCERRSTGRFVFTSTKGAWNREALKSAMRRLDVDWTFHALRAKAESDHATGMGLMARYKRARRIRPTR